MPIRTLPNNIEAEESVLGACFLSKYAMQKASENAPINIEIISAERSLMPNNSIAFRKRSSTINVNMDRIDYLRLLLICK